MLGALTESGSTYFLYAGERRDAPVISTLSDIGEMFFCYALSLLGLFWAEIEYTAAKRPQTYTRRVRPAFFGFLSLYAVLQCVCWLLLYFLPASAEQAVNKINCSLDLGVYAVGTIFTMYYACLVLRRVLKSQAHPRARRRKVVELAVVSLTCIYFYLCHALTTVMYMLQRSVRLLGFVKIVLVALFSEVAPALALLFVLRHVPPRSTLARPINAPPYAGGRRRYSTFLPHSDFP